MSSAYIGYHGKNGNLFHLILENKVYVKRITRSEMFNSDCAKYTVFPNEIKLNKTPTNLIDSWIIKVDWNYN